MIFICFVLIGCRKYDNIRDPILVEKIDWQYFTKEGKGDPASIQQIRVYSDATKYFRIERLYFQQFSQLMLDNSKKIYKKPKENTMKIYFRFMENNSLLASLYYDVNEKYNGKASTFYVDKSLLPELEKIKIVSAPD
ncbi:hypothetical protein J5Y03_19360 [Bacillus sp. RG28]|uniref:Uncharacterized protein n=1 Tax=Gottfriedia endophytica TaxID=2820819 RepID=A0A940SKP9_9BACI|nr:hypothetical protein [Gottfriedia endophytica]MBP0727310.1 hypothetical protein [Gottfriedia endophytica]